MSIVNILRPHIGPGAPAASPPAFVRSSSDETNLGGSTYTFTLPSSLEDELIIIAQTCDDAIIDTVTSGWTIIDLPGNSAAPGSCLAWKIMPSTPDTTVVLDEGITRSSICAMVFSGVNTSTPMDVTPVAISGNGAPNPPAITTITNNTMIVAIGMLDDDTGQQAVVVVPSGYSNLIARETTEGANSDATTMMATKVLVSLGIEDPAAFGGGLSDAFKGATVALRPA